MDLKEILILIAAAVGLVGILAGTLAFFIHRKNRRAPVSREEEAGRRKGKLGETQISTLLARSCRRGDRLLNNVILSNKRSGSSTEIDHILVSTRGVFVIETKTRSGDIYGDDYQEEWVQILARGEIRHTFYSPVKQNEGHISFVRDVTGVSAVEGLVVFTEGNTQFITSSVVCTPAQLVSRIAEKSNVLTPAERDEAYSKLLARIGENTVTAEEHEEYVRRRQSGED